MRGQLVVDMAGSGHLLVPTLLCVAVVLDAFGKRQRGAQPDMPVSRVHCHTLCVLSAECCISLLGAEILIVMGDGTAQS